MNTKVSLQTVSSMHGDNILDGIVEIVFDAYFDTPPDEHKL